MQHLGLDFDLYQISMPKLNIFFRGFLRNHTYNKGKSDTKTEV